MREKEIYYLKISTGYIKEHYEQTIIEKETFMLEKKKKSVKL